MPENEPNNHSHLAHAHSLPSLASPSFQNLPEFSSFAEGMPSLNINISGLPQTNVNPFEEVCKIEAETKVMLQEYTAIIDKVLASDKPLVEEEIEGTVDKLKDRYESIMKMVEILPLYEEGSLENYEKDVLNRHKESVGKFKEALSNAMAWKKEIHSVINYELQNNL